MLCHPYSLWILNQNVKECCEVLVSSSREYLIITGASIFPLIEDEEKDTNGLIMTETITTRITSTGYLSPFKKIEEVFVSGPHHIYFPEIFEVLVVEVQVVHIGNFPPAFRSGKIQANLLEKDVQT